MSFQCDLSSAEAPFNCIGLVEPWWEEVGVNYRCRNKLPSTSQTLEGRVDMPCRAMVHSLVQEVGGGVISPQKVLVGWQYEGAKLVT
jgi:hypothetical protein